MKKIQHVQLFTVTPEHSTDNCEIDAKLVSISYKEGVCLLRTQEENGRLWEHHFPLHNIAMVRLFYD